MSALDKAISEGAIPAHLSPCPPNTKIHLLEVGWLEADEAFMIRGANTSLSSSASSSFVNKRRALPMYCVLIDHPHEEGLILWETGAGPNYPETWGPQLADVFTRVRYEPRHELKAAVEATGHKLEEIKKVVIGHLHLDHAGGLETFYGRKDVQILVHERELKGAFWSVATGADEGVYLGHYLRPDLNWKTFDDQTYDLAQGLTLHHLPGHTDGLCGLQINLRDSGAWLFASDHYHVIENMRDDIPQGWLARDHISWFKSTQRVKQLQRVTKCRVIPGHDEYTWNNLLKENSSMTWT